jgi:uncharacterized membrane protein (DUF485 family)
MSATLRPANRRVRNSAWALGAVALGFYLGFIVLLVYRSHH